VDSNGNINGVKAGTTNITATTVNNLSATCQVTVSSTSTEKSISYQTHVENDGWMGWTKNGESAGTAGLSYRLEGIRIKIVPKGDPAPGSTTEPFIKSKLLTIQDKLEVTWISEASYVKYALMTLPILSTLRINLHVQELIH